MERFGSSRLRIVWTCLSLLLAGLVLGGIQGFGGPEGKDLSIFGTAIPLGVLDDPKPYVLDNLGRVIYALTSGIVLLAGYFPLAEWIRASATGERFKGLVLGTGMAFAHGLFLSQVMLLPVWAASFRLLGTPFHPTLLLGDLNALLLGLELLLWAAVMSLAVKSNKGLALGLTFCLQEIGRVMTWGGEWLGDMEVPKGLVKTMAFFGHLFPSAQLPSDPFAWHALPLSLGGPLLLAGLLLLLPGGKKARG